MRKRCLIQFRYSCLFTTVFAALCCASAASSAVEAGRHFEPGKRFRIAFSIGDVSPIEGSVQETNRPINDFRAPEKRDNAESFTLADLGMRDAKEAYGLSLEKGWKYITWFTDATYFAADAATTAPRDLYLAVEEIQFQGNTYAYQQIPEGALFQGSLDAVWINTRLAFTPVTFNPGGAVQFVPWIHIGLLGLVGSSQFDAGPPTAVIQYENPPRDYVVGGSGDGDLLAFAPEVGVGGELAFAVGRGTLSLQGNYSVFEFAGTSNELGVSSRNEKAINLDYSAIDGRILFERPMNGGSSSFVLGAEFRTFLIDASVEALDRSVEEILTLREKFNKDILFELTTVNLSVGFRF